MACLNDVATCLSKIVHEFNNDLTQRIQVVSTLSRFLGRIETLSGILPIGEYYVEILEVHDTLKEFCKNNHKKIITFLPDLKDALTDYLTVNPWFTQDQFDYSEAFMEYEEKQHIDFIIALKSQFKI